MKPTAAPPRRNGAGLPLLLLALLCAATLWHGVAASCTSRPPPLSSSKVTKCKYLILGGGPGGMFSAYLMRALGKDVCVVERASASSSYPSTAAWYNSDAKAKPVTFWGGKMLDFPAPSDPKKHIGTCGLRFAEGQKDMRCLLSKLNMSAQASSFEDTYYDRGIWADNTTAFLQDGAYNTTGLNASDIDGLEMALINFAMLGTTNVNPLTGKVFTPDPTTEYCKNYVTVQTYLQDLLGSEPANFMMTGFPVPGFFTSILDVCQFFKWYQHELTKNNGTELYPVGGFSEFYIRIKAAATASGVRFFPNSDIKELYKVDTAQFSYVAVMRSGKAWAAERLIVNSAVENLNQIQGPLGCALYQDPHVQGQTYASAVVYNAYYPEKFWESFQRIPGTTLRALSANGFCNGRSEFFGMPYAENLNVSRPVYTAETQCIDMWLALFQMGGIQAVRQQVANNFKRVLPGVNVPEPTADIFYRGDVIAHFLKPGQSTKYNITYESVAKWALRPQSHVGLCMVGEAYAMWGAGWAQSAWQSVVACLNANYRDVLPQASIEDMNYIASGCDGQETFPNEYFPPTPDPSSLKAQPAGFKTQQSKVHGANI